MRTLIMCICKQEVLMKIAAHRGVSSLAPENTLSAFKKAAEMGCEWIELDVQLSVDNIPVVFHDQTVQRCTNGIGLVSEMKLSELKSLDAGSWFSETFRGEQIPTLEEVLQLAKQHQINVNIELKIYPEDDVPLLCDQIKLAISEAGIPLSSLLFSSFDMDAMKYMHQSQPTIKRGQLWETVPQDAHQHLSQIEAYSVHCDHRFLEEAHAKQLKQQGYKICCYTANVPEQVHPHKRWGVDMVFSDMPQVY